ncbi:hypothetical protein TNCV_2605091 [Trichonephila clavipes]|nr:hypothetical protein TNCV_2605091 [Trichonephila clavipes]
MFQCIRAANRVPTHRMFSAYDNQDYHPTSGVFPPTSHASETVPMTYPPCHILPTNQESPSHKGPLISDHIQLIRYEVRVPFPSDVQRPLVFPSATIPLP